MRSIQLPGRPDRRKEIVLLALANAPLAIALNVVIAVALSSGTVPPTWLLISLGGCLTGQALLLALWFSFSSDTLPFRFAVLLAAIMTSCLADTLQTGQRSLNALYRQSPPGGPNIDWYEFAVYGVQDWSKKSAFGVAMFLLAYAMILPFRRLLCTTLATAAPSEVPPRSKPQFQIYEWMLWTALVAAPLVLIRLVIRESPTAMLWDCVFLVGLLVPLLVGWLVLRATLAQRHAAIWTLGTFVLLAAAGWIVSEVAFWIEPSSGNASVGGVLGFWPVETFLLSAAGILSLNALVLRWLGFRLRRES